STKIDFSRLHDEKKTFILDNLRQQESDLVFTAPFLEEDGKESEVWIYILIENQSEPDVSMGFRMLFYMAQIWDTQRREWERNKVSKSQWNFRSRPFLRKPRVPHPTTQFCLFYFTQARHHGIHLLA
ncbi:Rpn family recombination-promoting nuclease/putative transposase, partial [bacterium]|nr:Rpn family recombination-promoting nuclease/putative transposase [bacterium]